MNKKEVKKAPTLRFKGFTNDWEQHSLENLYNKIGNAFVGKATPFFTNHGHFYLESNNIKDGRINLKDQKFINDVFYIKQRDKWLHTNDLVMVQSGDVGQTSVITQKYNNCAAHALIMFRKPKNEYISNFLNSYFQSDVAISKIDKLKIGNTVNHLLASDMKTFKVTLPKHNSEAQKIIHIFNHLNRLQVLQQRKLRLLKLLKKATQQNIFASTECLPKLKYRNLTEKWQLYRLKDVAKITMGQSPNSKNYTQNPIDHILVQGNADIRNGYVFPRIWTTEITKVANKGDIILCVRAPAGDVGRTKFNVVIGRGVAAIKGNDFIFQQLQFMKSSGYWKKYISGSTFESINSNDIKNAKIFCPSQLEQKNISSLLDDIDTSIQIQQKNILDFKYIKQFLLQNMFI
ncbi:restriction endonuclease subunit S [Lactobacillus sp. A27]|uniref:restriction endonuclease subunit S n=1 Tax=Lactobacillus sp. A27 TaxID=2796363 RepID=UPI00191CFCBD|nr:restriction endonuclease subunit S [Lactobacillus sp. A27]MBL1060693.1 restriction endonuclease subunit S [Lactobacillus sp. A27]